MPAKKFWIQTIFAFVLLVLPAVVLVSPWNPHDANDSTYKWCDFFYYYSEANLICTGRGGELYNLDHFRQNTEALFPDIKKTNGLLIMPEPPLAAPFIVPIGLIPATLIAYYVWEFVIVASLSISIVLWAEMFRFSERQYLLSAALLALSGPIVETIKVAKPTALVWLGWTLSVWLWQRKRSLMAGLVFAPWTLKPQQMLPFIALITGARQIRFLVSLSAATLVLFLASILIFGFHIYPDWLQALRISQDHLELTAPYLHPVLRGQLMRILGTDPAVVSHTITPVALAGYVVALLTLVILGNRFRQHSQSIKLTVACMPLGFIMSPYCQNYDLILLVPSVFAFFKIGWSHSLAKSMRIGILVVVSLCLLLFEMPFYTIIHYTYLEHNLIVVNPFFVSLSLLSAIFIWVAVRAGHLDRVNDSQE